MKSFEKETNLMNNVINLSEESFFHNDILDFSTYPDVSVANHFDKCSNKHIYIINLAPISKTPLASQIKQYLKKIISNEYIHDKTKRKIWLNYTNKCLSYLIANEVTDILDIDES